MYGGASSLFARTLELLDQLDLFDDMAQVGLVGRRTMTFRDGRYVQGRGWAGLMASQDTYFKFVLNIRLKYSEDIFRRRLESVGGRVHAPVKFVGFELDEDAVDDYRVTATCEDAEGKQCRVRSKYIVGCDGGSSAVRTLAGIRMVGADREDRWARIDGVIKTEMPDSRVGFGAIETKTHGFLNTVALDHGATRIGFPLSAELYAKYGRRMTKEQISQEAKAAFAPFHLEFETIDWHTVYVIKQHVAERLQDRERILLAGDAAHTHSSGSAQGMNTGVQDAVSLAWRLAGVLKGWYRPEVLANYSTERKAAAEELIANDEASAALISGRKTGKFKDRPEDTHTLLAEFMQSTGSIVTGLGISYAPSVLNDVEGSYPPTAVKPGHRPPDVSVCKNGQAFPVRLQELTKINGKFHVIIFTGELRITRPVLKRLRPQVDKLVQSIQQIVDFMTVVQGHGIVFEEHLGVEQFGFGCWDEDHSAHTRYQISQELGAIVVLRPDGMLGFVAPLDGLDKVVNYFGRLVLP